MSSGHNKRPWPQWPSHLTGAAFAAAHLVAAAAALADDPAHLEGQVAMAANEAKIRCAPALVRDGETCNVGEFGRVGAVAGREFFYALYEFVPAPGDIPYPRVVIFEQLPAATVRPILISGDDAAYSYDKPTILHSAGRVLLHIPASEEGTGNFNREILYVWERDSWRDVDVTSWLDELGSYLSKGLGVQKGVYPDYATMKAETPLWREDDSGNCPNGGRARIDLKWRSDRIAVRRVRTEKSIGECGEPAN